MVKKEIRAYLADIGRRGGQSGRGPSKHRGAAHYERITRLAAKARAAKRAKE